MRIRHRNTGTIVDVEFVEIRLPNGRKLAVPRTIMPRDWDSEEPRAGRDLVEAWLASSPEWEEL